MAEGKPTKGILRKGKRAEKSGQQQVRFLLPPTEVYYMEAQDSENFEMIESLQEQKQIKGTLKPEGAERTDRHRVRFDPSVSLLERLRYGAAYGIIDEIREEYRNQVRDGLALKQSGEHSGSVLEEAVELAGEVVQLAPNGDLHEDMTNKEDKEDEQVEDKSTDASGEIETDVARVYQEDSLEVKKILKTLMVRDYELMFETYDYEDVAEENQPCFKHLGAVWRKCARSKTPVLV